MFRIRMSVVAGLLLALVLNSQVAAHDQPGHAEPALPGITPASETAPIRLEYTVDAAAAEPPVARVALGATVMLTVHGAGDHMLHLHGYDIEAGGDSHLPATFLFEASHAGRFPVVMHVSDDLLGRSERAVLYIEVRAQ